MSKRAKKTAKRETSPRFTEKPREVIARSPMVFPDPASERVPTDYAGYNLALIKRYAPGKQSYTWRIRGGMCGAPASHMGTVPQAFFR